MPLQASMETAARDVQWLESLVAHHIITPQTAERLLELHRTTGEALPLLVQRDAISDDPQVGRAIADCCGLPWLSLKETPIDAATTALIPARIAERYAVMPVRREGDTLVVALGDVTQLPMLDHLRVMLRQPLRAYLTASTQWRQAFLRHYGAGASVVEALVSSEEDHNIIQLVTELIAQAHHDRATDLHIDPLSDQIRIRQRVDGMLYEVPAAPGLLQLHPAIISRLKVMANLNIAERRLPQDGRFRLAINGDDVDVRLSTLPSLHGESVDLRLLPMHALYHLHQLGLLADQQATLEVLLHKPHGILFVTGPTGHGKTTTLYAYIRKLKAAHLNIVTVEDPVEQELPGVTQIQVHPKIELTFAAGLRSILRHDPDVIMVGEVRDPETAEIAIRSALTGHLVFSTLHTTDAASGAVRLLDMGVEPYLLASSVECFIAQRLVRLVCDQCRKPAALPSAECLEQLGVADLGECAGLVEGVGCAVCKGTGFRGRTGIFEVMVITEALQKLMLHHASAAELKRAAISQGMVTLAQVGWQKARQGLTTVKEVLRVI